MATGDRRVRWMVVLSVSGLALAGCTHVISQRTPYYEKGPSQLEPPQGELEKGTPVWIMGREGSYVRVWTPGLLDAWVRDRAVEPVLKSRSGKEEEQSGPLVIEVGP